MFLYHLTGLDLTLILQGPVLPGAVELVWRRMLPVVGCAGVPVFRRHLERMAAAWRCPAAGVMAGLNWHLVE